MGSGDLAGLSATKKPDVTAGKKRKKMVKTRLPQEVVDEILRWPVTPFPAISDEVLAGFSDECRAAIALLKADMEELAALDADIIRQYKDKGYAEVEEEVAVTDDDEEEEEKTEENDCPVKKKRKKVVKTRLPQELVEEIVRKPITPFPVIPDEQLAAFSVECRAAIAMQKADMEELAALDADIIRQYKDKGYAEVEEEVVVDEDEEQAEQQVEAD